MTVNAAYVWAWLSAFVSTQAIEVPIYAFALGRDREGGPGRWPARLGIAFLLSAVTHPCVWFVIPRVFYASAWYDELAYAWPALDEHRYALFFAAAEGFAVLVEAALLRAFKVERALLWALVANASSVAFGLVTRFLFDWP